MRLSPTDLVVLENAQKTEGVRFIDPFFISSDSRNLSSARMDRQGYRLIDWRPIVENQSECIRLRRSARGTEPKEVKESDQLNVQ